MADGINFNLLGVGEPSPYQQAQQRDMQNQLAQQQAALGKLQLQQAQQAAQNEAKLRELYALPKFDITKPEFRRQVYAVSPQQGLALEKEARALEAERAKTEKEKAETASITAKASREKLHNAIQHVVSFDTRQGILDDLYQQEASGGIDPDAAERLRASLPPTDEELPKWQMRVLRGMMSPEKQVELQQPKVVGNQLVTPSGEVLFKGAPAGGESDLARLHRERDALAAQNPDDPRLKDYDARISKLVNPAEHLSDLARKQSELADLEKRLLADPNNPQLKQRVKEYKLDIRKDTEWKPASVQVTVAPTLSKPAIDSQAERFLIDGTLPQLGMGKEASANRTAIINRAQELAKEKGISPDHVTQLENKANATALAQLTKQQTMVGAFEKNFNKNADLTLKLSSKVDHTGMPLLQKWINAGHKASAGDPDLKALDIAIKAVQNEYGKIVSGSMGNTAVAQGEIKRMEGLLSSANTPAEILSIVNTMKQETQNRMAGFKEQKAELTGGIRSSVKGTVAGQSDIRSKADAIIGGGK